MTERGQMRNARLYTAVSGIFPTKAERKSSSKKPKHARVGAPGLFRAGQV
jgi:hypothetical protein